MRYAFRRAYDFLSALAFCRVCPLCGKVYGLSRRESICGECSEKIIYNDVFAIYSDNTAKICALYTYFPPISDGIKRFKLCKDIVSRRFFKRLLGDIAVSCGEFTEMEAVVCVPRYNKGKQIKFNQADILAHAVAKRLRLPYCMTAIKKKNDNKSQTKCRSIEERKRNVRNVFCIAEPDFVRGKRILLVDDIMTTGATINACTDCLFKAGAVEVAVLVIARATKLSSVIRAEAVVRNNTVPTEKQHDYINPEELLALGIKYSKRTLNRKKKLPD